MTTILLLFFEFFQAGLFAVGGGLATLPFILKMMEKYPVWFGTLQLADITAIAESTPGPIGVNAATFAGYSAAGVAGAFTATLAVILPSFIIISLIARALQKYRDSQLVCNVFAGLRPAVTGLIAAACWAVMRSALITGAFSDGFLQLFNWKNVMLFAVLFTLLQLPKTKDIHPIFYILTGAAVGIVFGL
ncbi:MAG TPA: chromate transporter [Eubacteriales bacterium]|nr:chromate transporter [Eubacteriales bacterium]